MTVGIARALYFTNRHDIDITVMDDPMSALDAKAPHPPLPLPLTLFSDRH